MPFVEFAKYFKKNKNNERNLCFIEKQIVVALKRLVFNVFKENSEELKLKKYENYNFDLLGADFLITQDGEIFLLEVQYKPGLSFRKGSIGEGNKLLLREYFDILLKVRKNRILRKNGDDWVFPKYKKFLMIK
ncbi:hypothetical protein MHBO_001841 [Bonamia ostreae]|uniref:Uncharacterized protein n=1 Tax=Bonamia ostreae TaxID=126728 RepID=A0ABV2AKC6_9EUKA